MLLSVVASVISRIVSCAFLSFSANSIQLEDQQGRLEQEIRELLMKEGQFLDGYEGTFQIGIAS